MAEAITVGSSEGEVGFTCVCQLGEGSEQAGVLEGIYGCTPIFTVSCGQAAKPVKKVAPEQGGG